MVTHEDIANHIARRVQNLDVIMDGFAGVCGNVIAFAAYSDVIAIDIDSTRLDAAFMNASIYGCDDRIQFVHGDFFERAEDFGMVDAVFLSPPWGGPSYQDAPYDIFTMMTPDITKIVEMCNKITKNIIFYVPRNIDPRQLIELFAYMPNIQRQVHFELFCYGQKIKTIACYVGEIAGIEAGKAGRAILNQMAEKQAVTDQHGEIAAPFIVSDALVNHGVNAVLDHPKLLST